MSALMEIRLIAGRELARIRTKMFVITTAVVMLLLVAILVAVKLLGGSSALKVGFVQEGFGARIASVAPALDLKLESRTVATPEEGERLVEEGELDALVLDEPLRMVVKDEPDERLRAALVALARQAALEAELNRAGVDPGPVNQAVAEAGVRVVALEGGAGDRERKLGLALGLSIILFVFLQGSGLLVAQGVVEEKSSRVVELLLSAVRPGRLMVGKVIGLGVVGFLQTGLIAAAGVGTQLATGALDLSAGDLLGTVLWGLVWFVAGYALFAFLYAAVAATVSRQEEIGGVSAPLQVLLMVPYLLAFTVLPGDPDGPAARILSFVPFFAPILMPVRAVYGAPWWEQAAALAVTLATVGVTAWLAGRIYSYSVLRTGARVGLKEALRARSSA